MQGLIFIYEPERSKKNNQFTVRIEERRKQGTIWKQVGPKGFYTARDLQAPGLKIVDRQLFSMAFKAETDLRKQEGRFFSPDGEYTLFRISPYDLKSFLHRCRDRSVLCNAEGQPVHFKYRTGIVPGVEFHPSGDRFTPELTLAGKPMKPSDYTVISNPVRILCGRMVYELKRGLPYPLVHKLSQGRPLSSEAYEALLDELAGHTGKIDIRLPGIKKKILKKASATPVLNIDPGFKFAGLRFSYEGFGTFAPDDPRPVIFYPETNTELHRDFETEQRYSEMLKTSGLSHRPTPQGEWFIPKGQREALLKDMAGNGFGLMLSGRPLHLDARVDWKITTGEHAISVGGIVHSGGKKTDPENLLDAYLSEQPWFDLPNGACAFIPGRLSRELDRLSLRGDFRDDDIRFEHWDFSFLAAVFQNKDGKAERLPGDEVYHAYISFLNKMQDATGHPPVLATLEARLRPYQKIGYAWLTGLIQHGFGGILADDMGLGKTIQVLALLLHLKEKGRQSKSMSTTLLIVPKTLIWNWESEIKRFAPSLSTTIHTGPARDKHFSGCPTSDLVITSYGIVRRDIDALRRISWDLLILDEAQAVKNPDAQISKSVRRLNASNRLALTGTPIENRPLDLWSLFDFLMPGFLGDKTSFQDTYARQSTDALNLLGSLTAPFILRRMKSQVCTELPKKTEITQFCGFNEEQRQYYDDLMNRARDWLTGDNQPIQLLTLLLRLRQAACHPALVSGADVYRGSSGKFDAMIETAANILEGGHKILIFSQFVSLLDLVKQELETRGMPYYELYGSTRQREKVVQRFKRSDAPCVFLISLKAGGVGLNLTEAGYVFLLDPWWNPAVENQAIDRSYRIGQENPVTVYRFITKDSVEEKVNRLKERKRRVGETVLDHGEFKDTPFSTEELRMLIS